MASASGSTERPAPLHSATPYLPIIAYPLSAGLLPEGRQYTPMVPTATPMSTEGTGYLLPSTIPYSNNTSNYPQMGAAAPARNPHFRSTHHLSAHPLQEQRLEEGSTDHGLLPRREPEARAGHRADGLRSWTSVITPEMKGTISDHGPLAGSFSGAQAQAQAGARHPRPPLHSASSEAVGEAGWHHHPAREGLVPDLPRAPGGLGGLSSMPSLVDRPDLERPLGATEGAGADSRSLRCGLMPQGYLLQRTDTEEEEGERKMGTEMRMLTETPMGMTDGGYRPPGAAAYGDGGVDGYGSGGMEMYWHPTSSLPIKVESPPP